MRIAQPSTILGYLPLYIMQGNEIITYDTAQKAIEAINIGECDISIGDPFMMNYIDYEKKNIIIIAGFSNKVFHSVLTFDPFISIKNMKGKTIVSYPEPSTSFFLAKKLKKEFALGKILETPFNTELSPLLTQEADLAIVLEPNATSALKNGARMLKDFSNTKAVMTGLCTTKNFYEKNKKEIEEFLKQLKTSIKDFLSDDNILQKAGKYFPLHDKEVLADAIERLRKEDIYCENLKFTDEEIIKGLELRNINMNVEEAKRYIL